MATITEDYVSFETAKLLKEKGFDCVCKVWYSEYTSQFGGEKYTSIEFDDNNRFEKGCKFLFYAPTLQMAMKWLREKYNIYISIQPDFPSDKDYKMCWCCCVSILHENCISTKWNQCYIETYEKAVEAAIKYTLENLI